MKKNTIPLIISFLLITYLYNNFFTNGMLTGRYANKNYKYEFIGNIANKPDTLIIRENNEFESPYYGKGKYDISYSLKGTEIHMTHGEGYTTTTINGEVITLSNEDSFVTYINRIWFFGSPKIILFEDLGQCYEKID
ncbi:hypothetical protein NAT51_15000 [Flavobacterium amniphilum]|uniref:hypothetical protein n=1 Tax=Flavobacterium amniphilum TaxID=1834035 RepID=UPI002029DC1C|nr:hypothetical protein [Flavobacterium amniphilum]MCL9806841.1 hypothetical protein [Flavobacterium amniphilum]